MRLLHVFFSFLVAGSGKWQNHWKELQFLKYLMGESLPPARNQYVSKKWAFICIKPLKFWSPFITADSINTKFDCRRGWKSQNEILFWMTIAGFSKIIRNRCAQTKLADLRGKGTKKVYEIWLLPDLIKAGDEICGGKKKTTNTSQLKFSLMKRND